VNKWVLSATLLSLLTLGVHVFAGGTEIHEALLERASTFPDLLQTFISVMWHAITVVIAINSVVLFLAVYQSKSQTALAYVVIAQYLGYAALFAFYDLLNLGSLIAMPQWIVFTVISAMVLAGLYSQRKRVS
jgi:small-conductance mechanosensitive channel